MKTFCYIFAACLGIVVVSACRKQAAGPIPVSTMTLLDSVYVQAGSAGNGSAYKFFYEGDGYVNKISVYDIHGFGYNLLTDSLVYDAAHRLQWVYFTDVNGSSRNELLYDEHGLLSKINFRTRQGDVSHYTLFNYYAGHKLAAMGDYVNNTLHSIVSYTYDSSGNLSAELDSIISDNAMQYSYDAYDGKANFTGLLTGINIFILPAEIFPLPAANNVLKKTNTRTGQVSNYSYEYNADGFPTKRIMKGAGTDTETSLFFYKKQ